MQFFNFIRCRDHIGVWLELEVLKLSTQLAQVCTLC